jgi:hypothetical protein
LTADPNQQYIDLVPSRYEGRFAIVTSAGWDAVDVDVPLTNGADAYGEVVWSWRPVLIFAPQKCKKAAWHKDFFDFFHKAKSPANRAGLFFVS